MNKFNLPRRNIQKERRAKRAEKRRLRSSAASLKVSAKAPSRAITGKKSRKLQKKWRQGTQVHLPVCPFTVRNNTAQKEALQSGLVTMHDIEMMVVEDEGGDGQGSSQPKLNKSARGFHLKKRAKLRLKSSSSKGKQVSEPMTTTGAEAEDAMMMQ